jgi:hypothetical protein
MSGSPAMRHSRLVVAFEERLDRKLAVDGESGCISTVEVVMRPPEVFVRPLSHEEAVRLKRLSTRAKHQCTRQRATGADHGGSRSSPALALEGRVSARAPSPSPHGGD